MLKLGALFTLVAALSLGTVSRAPAKAQATGGVKIFAGQTPPAIAFVNEWHNDVVSNTSCAGSTNCLTITVATVAGKTVCVGHGYQNVATTTASVSDNGASGGSVYTVQSASGTGGGNFDDTEMWCTAPGASKAATLITIIASNSGNIVGSAREYSGVVHLGNICATGNAGSAAMSCALTTQDPNNWMVAAFSANDGGQTNTLNQGANALLNFASNQALRQISSADNTVATAGSLTVSITQSASFFWSAAGVELRTH